MNDKPDSASKNKNNQPKPDTPIPARPPNEPVYEKPDLGKEDEDKDEEKDKTGEKPAPKKEKMTFSDSDNPLGAYNSFAEDTRAAFADTLGRVKDKVVAGAKAAGDVIRSMVFSSPPNTPTPKNQSKNALASIANPSIEHGGGTIPTGRYENEDADEKNRTPGLGRR